MAVALITLSYHLALRQFQGREQRGGAVALVVVGHGPAAPLLHGQAGLSTIQGLQLALFIHAQHHRLLRWV